MRGFLPHNRGPALAAKATFLTLLVALGLSPGTAVHVAAAGACTSPSAVARGTAIGIAADQVYGQPNFTSDTANTGGVSATSLYGPFGAAVDRAGGLNVADYGNSRVLHYPAERNR